MVELFEIVRVDNSVLKDLIRESKQAHQHKYEEIIVVIKGTIEHFIDFESSQLSAPFASYITKGKTHRINPMSDGEDSDGFLLRFQSEFASETIFQLYYLFHEKANIIFSTDKSFNRFVDLCQIMEEEFREASPDFRMIRNLLGALIAILISEKIKSDSSHFPIHQDDRFIKFLKLLEENYHRSLSVSFYAEKLHMSSRNLNLICQKVLNKSISEIIQDRKLIQVKNLLTTTEKTISEIGVEIGYDDKSYFSNIFKKKTGKSPSEFRADIKKYLS
ncbi:MAG: AraC family transcriptional regulator [Bacteroidota bacterium]